LLGSGGYDTVAFESAGAYLSAGCPLADCLVVDVNMPGTNGLDLTRQLIQRGLHVPVVIVSVDAEDLSEAAKRAGAACAIPKIAAATRLLETIGEVLHYEPS
jgi:FixJ family two-component response regulator